MLTVAARRYTETHVINDYKRFQVKGQDTETHSASLMNMAQGYYNGSTNLVYRVILVLVAQTTWIRPVDNIPLVATSTANGADGGLNVNRCPALASCGARASDGLIVVRAAT